MEAPPIRYVTTADGVNIAYWSLGDGPPFVILPALPYSHICVEWEQAEWRNRYELTASARSVVRYDSRGTGLSQRDVEDFSLEGLVADLEAVIDDLGPGPVALEGVSNSSAVSITYAVRHPERVSHLVLWSPVIDTSVHLKNPARVAALRVAETDWGMFPEVAAHDLVGWEEPDAARRFAKLIRAGIRQDTLLRLVPAMWSYNVWADLPNIRCPTLVLHRPRSPLLPPGMAERAAATIPRAELVLLEGASSAPFIGDWRAIVRAIDGFLGIGLGSAPRKPGGRASRLLSMKNESLSPREREVVVLVVQGLTNREIADRLSLAEKTVENHMGRILAKLDFRSRTQLAAYAVEHRLSGTAGVPHARVPQD